MRRDGEGLLTVLWREHVVWVTSPYPCKAADGQREHRAQSRRIVLKQELSARDDTKQPKASVDKVGGIDITMTDEFFDLLHNASEEGWVMNVDESDED